MKILARGAVELLSPGELENKIGRGKPLRVKLGLDPTVADLHLGHTVVMQKLKSFQELGHQVLFLIGDFTATIGDPSGQVKTRPSLTEAEVKKNAETYLDQAFKILDKKKTEVRRNSEWLSKLSAQEIVALAGHYNVARMEEREDFKKRLREGIQITVREFLYPLLQGYDSVVLKADVELGGNDQKFNLAVARDIQRSYGQEPEVILTTPLLLGTDGVKKMSKSYGNYIGITEEPKEIFGKIMSLTDDLMWHYYELLTDEDIGSVKVLHPKEAKVRLGKILVTRFHSSGAALSVAEEFERVFARKETPADLAETPVDKSKPLVDLLVDENLAGSKSEVRRLASQNAIKVDGVVVGAGMVNHPLPAGDAPVLIQVGKRKFLKVRVR